MRATLTKILLLCVFVALTGTASTRLLDEPRPGPADERAEVLFVPSLEGAKIASFGYRNALANVLWFNTISYFGKHYRSDQRYTWLAEMCKLVTGLNPGERQIFEFCATMLAWEAEKPQLSYELLNDAVRAHPDYWRFYYLRGFTAMYFLRDDVQAQNDFSAAAKLPDADPWMARLATRKMATNGEPEAAVRFLQEMLQGARDENQRRALQSRLLLALHELNLTRLEEALSRYAEKTGHAAASLDELKSAGMLRAEVDFKDPWGGSYFLDRESGEVRSTSNQKRLRSKAKAAK